MPKANVINIDMDKKCTRCEEPGAVNQSGLCLECAGKALDAKWRKETDEVITEQIITLAGKKLDKHLMDHHREIDKAYRELEEDEAGNKIEALAVSLKVKLQQVGKKISMQTEINFSTGKVKDGDKVLIDPRQMPLFEG